jgi:hypothetical protein
MKSTLLLTDEAETTRLMLKDVAFDELSVRTPRRTRAAIAIAGGILVSGASTRHRTQSKDSGFITSQTVR